MACLHGQFPHGRLRPLNLSCRHRLAHGLRHPAPSPAGMARMAAIRHQQPAVAAHGCQLRAVCLRSIATRLRLWLCPAHAQHTHTCSRNRTMDSHAAHCLLPLLRIYYGVAHRTRPFLPVAVPPAPRHPPTCHTQHRKHSNAMPSLYAHGRSDAHKRSGGIPRRHHLPLARCPEATALARRLCPPDNIPAVIRTHLPAADRQHDEMDKGQHHQDRDCS